MGMVPLDRAAYTSSVQMEDGDGAVHESGVLMDHLYSMDTYGFDNVTDAVNSAIHRITELVKRGWDMDSYPLDTLPGDSEIPLSWIGSYEAMGETFTIYVTVAKR